MWVIIPQSADIYILASSLRLQAQMVESVLRKVGACAALVLCTAVATHALRELGGALPNASYDDALRARQQAYPALLYPGVVEIGTVLAGDDDEVDKEEYMMDAHPSRNLLHGCHGGRCVQAVRVQHA